MDESLATAFGLSLSALVRRLIYRLLTAPIYLLIAIPWAFILIMTIHSSDALSHVSQILAYLSGKPLTVTRFDGGDITRAVTIVFLAANVMFESIYLVLGRHSKTPFYKFETEAKILICSGGWLLLAVIIAFRGQNSLGVSLLLMGITLSLIGTEYVVLRVFNLFRAPSMSKIQR